MIIYIKNIKGLILVRKFNKFLCLLIVFSFFFININVYARDCSIDELVSVSEEVNVVTDSFVYKGIKFVPDENNVANGKVVIDSITNNTKEMVPPSISILLFDAEMKNIGYITYCASKDYDSDNSHVKISGNSSIPFSFKVSPRYFGANEVAEGEFVADSTMIAFYAIHDNNKYCQIGGYTKYLGHTIEEITGGDIYERDFKLNDLILYLPYYVTSRQNI